MNREIDSARSQTLPGRPNSTNIVPCNPTVSCLGQSSCQPGKLLPLTISQQHTLFFVHQPANKLKVKSHQESMSDSSAETDLYGFQLGNLTVQQQAIRLQNDGSSRRAEAAWVVVAQQQQLPPEAKLKSMIRLVGCPGCCKRQQKVPTSATSDRLLLLPPRAQGIPPTLRTFVWMQVSGAAAKQAAVAGNYFTNVPCGRAVALPQGD